MEDAIKAINRKIGQHLRTARVLRGFSQVKVARMIGMRGQQIQKYESGACMISAARMKSLAQALGVPINYFFRLPEVEIPPIKVPAENILQLVEALQRLKTPAEKMVQLVEALHRIERAHSDQFTLLYKYIVGLAEAYSG